MHALAKTFPICVAFFKNGCVNSSISRFLNTYDTEECERPLYYSTCHMMYQGRVWVAVTYMLFYDKNPGYRIACWRAGAHAVDLERIVVLFDIVTLEPEHVFFGAHGRGQGMWCKYSDCDKHVVGENQVEVLKVYVAPQSNAFYPNSKTYWRVFGFANDVCTGDKKLWMPGYDVRCDVTRQSWTTTHHQLGPGINAPTNITVPWTSSITNKQRFFLAFPQVRKKVIEQGEPIQVVEK